MKIAAYIDRGVMEIREIATPEPEDHEILVKIEYCGICGSDIHQVQYGMEEPDNIMMGHEASGVVVQVGKSVERWQEGDRVIVDRAQPCGQCWYCKNLLRDMCKNKKWARYGGYAEYMVCFPENLYRLPDDVSLRAAALWNPMVNSIHAVKLSRQRLDDFVVVMGAGPIGLFVIAAAKRLGASRIFATEILPQRAEAARKMGADLVLNPLEDNVLDAVTEFREVGADVVYECAGAANTLQEAIQYARCGGQVVLVAIHMEFFDFSTILWVMKEVNIQAAFGHTAELDLAVEMLSDGTVNEDDVITSEISLEQLPETMKKLFGPNEEIKVLVKP
jgi:(R,R)-butanediol dehydrogenase/meso-butanediol dehydrogenase/diacetyl reductase